MKKSKFKIRVVQVFIVIFIVHFIFIMRIEFLTFKYGYQFNGLQNSMISNIEYLKVLNYNDDTATIYYVTQNKTSGNICEFKKDTSSWMELNWNTIWSSNGNASNFIFPYWWDTFLYSLL